MERIFHLIDKAAGKWLDWRTEHYLQSDDELSNLGLKKGEIDEETGIKRVEVFDDRYEAAFITPAVAILAEEAAKMLDMSNAQNYLQFDLMPRLDRGLRPIRMTVAWAYGVMPGVKAARLEKALKLAITMIESLKDGPKHAWNEADEAELNELRLALHIYKEPADSRDGG